MLRHDHRVDIVTGICNTNRLDLDGELTTLFPLLEILVPMVLFSTASVTSAPLNSGVVGEAPVRDC